MWGAMSLSLILGVLWVLAAACVAFLPMRRQYIPAFALLILAPFLIGFLGYQHGILWVLIGTAAFASMFRNPLIFLFRYATGQIELDDDE